MGKPMPRQMSEVKHLELSDMGVVNDNQSSEVDGGLSEMEYDVIYHTPGAGANVYTLNVGGVDPPMKINMGASCSVITKKVYDSLTLKPGHATMSSNN